MERTNFCTGEREAFAVAEGDRACAVAERLTRKGWPLAANPWRALRKCNVGHAGSTKTLILRPTG